MFQNLRIASAIAIAAATIACARAGEGGLQGSCAPSFEENAQAIQCDIRPRHKVAWVPLVRPITLFPLLNDQNRDGLVQKSAAVDQYRKDRAACLAKTSLEACNRALGYPTLTAKDADDLNQARDGILAPQRPQSAVQTQPPRTAVDQPRSRLQQDFSSFRKLFEDLDNVSMLAAGIALILGLMLIGASLRGRRRAASELAPQVSRALPGLNVEANAPTSTPSSDAEKDEVAVPETIYGWLQFLDAGSTRVPVTATSLRIGRHRDNDICLPNDSVHRQHAVLHKTSLGTFVIRDLGTKNGIVANGKRCGQHELAGNDLIELGEVRFRFVLNKAVAD